MEGNHQSVSDQNRRHVHEGPKNHYLSFLLSVLLTVLAFIVVNANMGETFTVMFIVLLAVIQVLFQLAFWMHLKDRGHLFPIIGISLGAIVMITAVAAVVFWLWW